VEQHLPGSYEVATGYFHKKGAYSRFKGLPEPKEQLDVWHRYEAIAVETALRKWCVEDDFLLVP
jgi:hypothetical protein